jgi:hypothetical protein
MKKEVYVGGVVKSAACGNNYSHVCYKSQTMLAYTHPWSHNNLPRRRRR